MGFSLSDLDPTNRKGALRGGLRAIDPTTPEGQRNLLYGGTLGGAAIVNESLGDPANFGGRIDARKRELEARRAKGDQAAKMELERIYFEELANKYRDVPTNQATQDRAEDLYSRDMQPEIDRGMYGATSATSRSYESRGMGASGYNASAQSQAIQAAAQERTRARSRALDIATAEGRSSLTGEAQLHGMGTGLVQLQYQNALIEHQRALDRQAQERAEYRNLLAGIGGRAAGAYLGGGMGMQIGGQLADGGYGAGGYAYDPIFSPELITGDLGDEDDGMYVQG